MKREEKEIENSNDTATFNVHIAGEEQSNRVESDTVFSKKEKEEDKSKEEKEEGKESANTMQVLHHITSEDEEEDAFTPMTLASILGGDILGGKWFRKQFWYMLMLTGMILVYVANRYACQQEMIQTKVLSDTLLDRRYKSLTRSSQLKERTRRSYIEQNLSDSTLKTAKTPLFNLNVQEP